jgi:hypothetical protein
VDCRIPRRRDMLYQRRPNYGPRATSGPPRLFMRPALLFTKNKKTWPYVQIAFSVKLRMSNMTTAVLSIFNY